MDNYFLSLALKEAKKAYIKNEVPVGCVIVKNNVIIAKSHNLKELKKNSLYHAELIAINKACRKLNTWRLENCILYVTLEPCMMCTGAILESRISKVYYGTKNNSKQMFDCKINNGIELINMQNKDCSSILSSFFKNKRLN